MKNVKRQTKKNLYLFLLMLFSSLIVTAQDKAFVKGIVVDGQNEPVIGATIVVRGNHSIGTATDIEGKFSLSVSNTKQTLVVSYIGMVTQEVKIEGNKSLRIVLKDNNVQLNEIVVVGYGQQRKLVWLVQLHKLPVKYWNVQGVLQILVQP
jgi:hypothetical protein